MAEEIIQILTHEDDAVARLAGQYKGKPRIEALVRSIARQIQDLENAAFSVLVNDTLELAEGDALDLIGSLVEQPRQGFADDFYRILIKVKIAENFSEGQPRAIIQAFRLIMVANVVHYQNLGLGCVGLFGDGTFPPVNAGFVYDQLERILADGVSITYISTPAPGVDAADTFCFAGGPIGVGKGFSDIAETVGGKWAGLVERT